MHLNSDNGFEQSSAGEFNVDSSGVVGGRFKILTGGYVGIGTASPSQKLHVSGGDVLIDGDGRLGVGEFVSSAYKFSVVSNSGDARGMIRATSPTHSAYLMIQAGPGGDAQFEIEADLNGTGTSNPRIHLIGSPYGGVGSFFVMGIDNSDDQKFKMGFNRDTAFSTPAVTILSNDNVGIGTTNPTYRLQLSTDSAGKPNGGSWANSSDIRLKKNIAPITGALDKITQLQGVNFEWINSEEHQASGIRQGFIAQAVEKVFPNFITEIDASGKDKALTDNGKIKSLSLPFDFDAYLVEAIKELKAENDALKARVEALESRIR